MAGESGPASAIVLDCAYLIDRGLKDPRFTRQRLRPQPASRLSDEAQNLLTVPVLILGVMLQLDHPDWLFT